MSKIKNVSPIGDLVIPALGNLVVKAGESVDVSDEAAASLLEQSENWVADSSAPVSAPTPAPAPSTPATADATPAANN